MKTILHKAKSRGLAEHGWLRSNHTFSFARYYNPERMGFGTLRVLNDDHVAPARGFGEHPHDNMEIISIPLSGDLMHFDSMGNEAIIKQGDVQAMTAGTGISHGEKNANTDKPVDFLQIWVYPKSRNVKPSYSQITLDPAKMDNQLAQVVSPNPDDDGVTVNQDAWFHLGDLKAGTELEYEVKKDSNGVYAFVIEGNVTVAGQELNRRDGLGISETNSFGIKADGDARLLLMDVPMDRPE